MRRGALILLNLLLVISFIPVLTPALADPPAESIDDFGTSLAYRILSAKIHSFAVAAFVAPDGASSPRTGYLTARLCEVLLKHHPDFALVKPPDFQKELASQKLSGESLSTAELLRRSGTSLRVEAVLTGKLEDNPDGYLLSVSARNVSDGKVLLDSAQILAHSKVLDSLAATDADTTDAETKAGIGGTGIPKCNYAPVPVFPDGARKAKISAAVVILGAVVTPDGRITNIRVLKDPGYGFALRAAEALSEWHCKPALDKDKKPVAVRVPIEITFRE